MATYRVYFVTFDLKLERCPCPNFWHAGITLDIEGKPSVKNQRLWPCGTWFFQGAKFGRFSLFFDIFRSFSIVFDRIHTGKRSKTFGVVCGKDKGTHGGWEMGPHVRNPSISVACGRSLARIFSVPRTHVKICMNYHPQFNHDVQICALSSQFAVSTTFWWKSHRRSTSTRQKYSKFSKNYRSAHEDPSLNPQSLPQTTPGQCKTC